MESNGQIKKICLQDHKIVKSSLKICKLLINNIHFDDINLITVKR